MICQVYPIYAHKGDPLSAHIDYIMNPIKVVPQSGSKSAFLPRVSTAIQPVQLIASDGSPHYGYAGGYLTTPAELEQRIEYLRSIYEHYRPSARTRGPIAYQIILSASPDEIISGQEIFDFTSEVVASLRYPAVWASHIRPVWDERWKLLRGMCKHSHIIISGFPDDPYEIPQKLALGFHYQRLREVVDRLAIEHGYEVVVDADVRRSSTYYGSIQAKKGKSWLQDAREELSQLADKSAGRDDYEQILDRHGYSLNQIGPDFHYTLPTGHQAMGHTLGRQHTLESLENRWSARREGSVDVQLEAAEATRGPLYVRIPLGGRFKDAKTSYRCNLRVLATACTEGALNSYFQSGCMYEVLDENGNLVRRVEGGQILHFLGCGDAALDTSENFPSAVRKRRLEWHLQRIELELDRRCERYTSSAELRYDYQCRWREKHRPLEDDKVWVEPNLEAYAQKSKLEIFLLRTLEELIPTFDSGLWTTLKLSEVRAGEERLQRAADASAILHREGIESLSELDHRTAEAQQRYDQLAQELAEHNLEIEALRPLMKALRSCRAKREAFDACCSGAKSFSNLWACHRDVAQAYDEAVGVVAQEVISNWSSFHELSLHYELLHSKRTILRQAVGSEFERKKILELAQRHYQLQQYAMQQACDTYVLPESTPSAVGTPRKPSLADQLQQASNRKSPASSGRTPPKRRTR